ncbi:hypothetical protein [Methanopyrus sp. SNP6]|uniref:hypothetical protein n=1 Tax=Methanopyrus sp. SNP6 TaxID=1937005 RepID=UPI0014398E7A|nr:hypothetical protein [Methanopyrus sp. SNP6]
MEIRITTILAIVTIIILNFIVEYEAPDLGKHIIYLDLAIQSLKAYLIEKYGLSGSDWDPYSYLGRPPLANYPILPFMVPVAIHKFLVKDIFLATCIGEELLRLAPIIVWIILQILNLNSAEATVALLAYLALYPIAILYEVKYIRIATTMSYSLAAIAVIIWNSKLKDSIKRMFSFVLWTTSLYSNFIYSIPPLIVAGILDSPIFFLPIIVTFPVLLFASSVGKLEFDNLPESTTMGFSIFDVYDIVLATIVVTSITFLSLSLLNISRKKKFVIGTIGLIPLFGLVVFLSPKVHYTILGISKTLTQLDMYRMPLITCTLVIIVLPKIFSKIKLSTTTYSAIFSLISVGIILKVVSSTPMIPIIVEYEFSSPTIVSHDYRTSNTNLGLFSLACPLSTLSKHPTYILGGAFYQGCSEVNSRILSSILFLNSGGRECCEQLAHPGQCQLFDEDIARKVLTLLPLTSVDYGADIKTIRSYSDIVGFTFSQKPTLSLWDVIPITSVKVIYVGSYTNYSFLWLNLVRSAPTGYFPMIPMIRPYNVERGQSLPAEQIPWSGDILVVDSEALGYPETEKLAKEAKEVIVVYSSRAFDAGPPSKVVRRLKRITHHIHVLGPVHHSLHSPIVKRLARESCVKLSPIHDALHRVSNDKYVLDSRGHRFVVVPWAWAPFWAVDGREGQTCPVGPYMLVKTDGKLTTLHYVAWERHQSKAYALSLLLLLTSITAITILRKAKIVEIGAEGRL